MATPTKLPTRTKTEQLVPSAAVKSAYDLKMTPEALGRLKEIGEAVDYAAEQTAIASRISIKDEDSNAAGADVVVNLAKTSRVLEELRKYFTDPLEQRKKVIIAVFKKLGLDAAGQEERLRKELGDFFMKKENERRAAETKRLADEEAARRRARAVGRSAPPPIAAAPAPEVQRSTQAENGSVGITLEWAATLVDANFVPEKYWVIDQKQVDADVRGGAREIPGYSIQQRPRTAVR
ncbi:MAG: hypothetical protein PHS14_09530 [Elusimicrobia bacterium]|nr:hypothetical protein [Elusimicrobiota bacterium]